MLVEYLFYEKYLASVIRYITTKMDPPSHTGLFSVNKLTWIPNLSPYWLVPNM